MKLTVFLFFDFQRSQKTVTLNQQTLILCQKICYTKKKKITLSMCGFAVYFFV